MINDHIEENSSSLIIVDVQKSFRKFFTEMYINELSKHCKKFNLKTRSYYGKTLSNHISYIYFLVLYTRHKLYKKNMKGLGEHLSKDSWDYPYLLKMKSLQ